ncbi:MAG: hypothetical protein U9O94_00555 [Nanoarchaeota archaeon]|nr:hypothetical protein [Nanoarchaeota archaeon]
MKKAQLTARPIMYSLFTLVAVLILVFGTVQIINWGKQSEDVEQTNFVNTLKNVVEKQSKRSQRSVDEQLIALPSEIESVCLVDRSKEISPLVNGNLNAEINTYENKNVFFEPFGKFTPLFVDNFELSGDENPLCIGTLNGGVGISVTSTGKTSLISALDPNKKKIDCVSVVYNKEYGGAIDIVFLPFGYRNFDDFRGDVNSNINTFLTTEPFMSNQGNMNFQRVDKLNALNCEVGDWVKCDEFSVKKLASYCPHDYIVVLVDRNKIRDFIMPVRSSAVGNMEKINTADNKLVILHEFGHIFGELADEYVDERYYSNIGFDPRDYPNCDLPPECIGWKGTNGTGCFEGCSLGDYSRPTENSIMRALNTEKFGPLNERILIDKLVNYGDKE